MGLWPWRPVGTGFSLTRAKGWLDPLTTTAATTGIQTAATDQQTRLPSPPRAVSTSLEYSPVVRAALLLTPSVLMASLKRLKIILYIIYLTLIYFRYIVSLVWPMIIECKFHSRIVLFIDKNIITVTPATGRTCWWNMLAVTRQQHLVTSDVRPLRNSRHWPRDSSPSPDSLWPRTQNCISSVLMEFQDWIHALKDRSSPRPH